jgi:predicted acetyltransferase
MTEFVFNEYEPFTDGEIEVSVDRKNPANDKYGYVHSYDFAVKLAGSPVTVGRVSLRIGNTENVLMYAGHIGYGINEKYRGHRYAAKACSLIRPVALDYDLKTLWITCNPDNYPSRRTCEILGCELVEIVDLPEDSEMYRRGERQKCRYRWDIGG